MNTEKPSAERLFLQAVEAVPESQWEEFVRKQAADDPTLCEQVLKLLSAHKQPGAFLSPPAKHIEPTFVLNRPTLLGSQIGPYKLREQIGEGGMGIVFLAEQMHPIRRRVALKIIKPGMDSRQVVNRFESERQALAMMDHPNIARVLDAGVNDLGLPYFVMELVQGLPLTEYCDSKRLTPAERIALFLPVCHAVQHAHQKGIIHRDLKPSNVMVTIIDGKPVPKVIDFGIAKAIGQQLTQNTIYTGFQQILGTPLYMSPEQAEFSGSDVDTRSDIYSLGVMLYELLTGQTPFAAETLSSRGIDEFRRRLREEEPPRPSARISTLTAEILSTMSGKRSLDERQFRQALKGEVDWIVMKAIDKERDRRYATANDLAADLQRFLEDKPVEACRPTVRYRASKFVRRYRGPVLTAGGVLGVVLASAAVSIFAFFAERAARKESDQSRKDAESHAKVADEKSSEAKRQAAVAEKERQRAESALYVTDTRLAAAEIQQSAHMKAMESLLRHDALMSPGSPRGWEWYYLLDQAVVSQLSWQGGPTNVQDIAWNPIRKQIATIHWESPELRLWDSENGKLIRQFECSRLLTVGVSWSPDGTQLAWGSTVNDDNKTTTLRIWDSATDRITELAAEGFSHRSVEWSPDGTRIAACSIREPGGMPRLLICSRKDGDWQVERNETWQNPEDHYDNLAWNRDGTQLFIGCREKSVIVDPSTLQVTYEFPLQSITRGTWLRDRNVVATIRAQQCLLFDLDTQQEVHRFDVGPVRSLHVSPNGELLVTGGGDGFVKLWKVADWSLVAVYEAHDGPVSSTSWSPDSRSVASCGMDGRIHIWPAVKKNSEAFVWRNPSGGRFVWTEAGAIQIYDPDRGVVTFEPTTGTSLSESKLTTGGKWQMLGANLASMRSPDQDGQGAVVVERAGPPAGPLVTRIEAASGPYGKADGKAFAYFARLQNGFGIPAVRTVGSASEVRLGSLGIKAAEFRWSPDGRSIAAIGLGREGDDGTPMFAGWVHLFDLQSGAAIGRTRIGVTRVGGTCGSWSPDSQRIACASSDGICEVFAVPTLSKRLSRRMHRQSVRGMSWHPKEERIASGSADGTIAVWDSVSGELLIRFEAGKSVEQVEWSPDGRMLAARVSGGDLRIWDATAGYQLAASASFQDRCIQRLEAEFQAALFVDDVATAWRLGKPLNAVSRGDAHWLRFSWAVLALSRGEDQEYQQACAKMVEQASASDDDTSRRFAVWACCLGAEAVSSYEPVIALVRTGVPQHPDSQQDRINLGGILMRAGQFEEARKVLDHPTAAATDGNSSVAYVHYFLAMTQHHLGNASEAALQLRRANDLANQDLAATTSWRRKVSLELLRKEAESLISSKE